MRLPDGTGWLGYCLNVHPTQNYAEARAALLGPVRTVKQAVCPNAIFGVGLRLSAEAASDPVRVGAELATICDGEGYVAFTMNGFPFGAFHSAPVKTAVYEPDWTTDARRLYTRDLAVVMAAVAPPNEIATISTVPGGFGPRLRGREGEVAEGLIHSVADLLAIERETGRLVALALEPEPWCLLETTDDAIAFFRDWLFSLSAVRRLANITGLGLEESRGALARHLGLCLDVCHLAVAFETPANAIAKLASAGVPILKLQLSAALRIEQMTDLARRKIATFHDEIYLHQVTMKTSGGAIGRVLDLPEALARETGEPEEWRVHYHVPVFAEIAAPLGSTRHVLEEVLALHRAAPICRHLEVETYTWDVLPPSAFPDGVGDVTDGLARELIWVRRRLS